MERHNIRFFVKDLGGKNNVCVCVCVCVCDPANSGIKVLPPEVSAKEIPELF